jgi:hypothetical protein
MASFRHKRTMESDWERDGSQIKRLIESGLDWDKRPIGVPYGSIAQ